MAIVILNKTLCPVCNKEFQEGEEILSFPSFVQNIKDPFYQFNDTAYHSKCLKKHILGNKAIDFLKLYFFKTKPENRICSISGRKVEKVENYIFIDLLTSNKSEKLFEFNFITFDKKNLINWDKKEEFLMLVKNFIKDGKWVDFGNNKYLENLIERIESPLPEV